MTSWFKAKLGRVRVSTAVLLLAFIALFWVHQTFQPQQPEQTPAVVPPGFVPDPNYTWVPRTNVRPPEERTYTTTTTRPTTTTPTTTATTSPTSPTDTTSPAPTTGPTTTTGPAPTSVVDPDGPGPLAPVTLPPLPTIPGLAPPSPAAPAPAPPP